MLTQENGKRILYVFSDLQKRARGDVVFYMMKVDLDEKKIIIDTVIPAMDKTDAIAEKMKLTNSLRKDTRVINCRTNLDWMASVDMAINLMNIPSVQLRAGQQNPAEFYYPRETKEYARP